MKRMDIFLETLKELMDEINLNQMQLANMINVSSSSIVHWYEGATCPKVVNLIKIAEAFGCSIDYLFGFTDEKLNLHIDKTVSLSDFLERYNELKISLKLTDHRISKLCKFGNSTVSKWKRFNRYPSTPIMLKLAELFECTFDYLLGSDI